MSSLRADIHAAFDEVAPSTAGLPERIVDTAADASSRTLSRRRWIVRFRAPLSLVAVLMLISLVVGALAGGRLASDWRDFVNRTHPAGINLSQLHQLESRPLRLPRFTTLDACPTGPWDPSTGWRGLGPVYGAGGSGDLVSWGRYEVTSWGMYFVVMFESEPTLRGPLLVRARTLNTAQDLVFVGNYAAGPVVGTDQLLGRAVEHHPELVLDASQSPKPKNVVDGDRQIHMMVEWNVTAGLAGFYTEPKPEQGVLTCTLWQIDGLDFTENFVTD